MRAAAYGVLLAVWLALAPAFLVQAPAGSGDPSPRGGGQGLHRHVPGL